MYACLKQSGELVTSRDTAVWTPDALAASAKHIADLYSKADALGIKGLMMVSGGGNIVRGRDFPPDKTTPAIAHAADPVARWGTVMNTIMLSSALTDAGVPNQMFTAEGMHMRDTTLGDMPVYRPDDAQRAYADSKVVLIGGGTGQDGCTTDAAVAWYAIDLAKYTGDKVSALKATNVDGVFYGDPRKNPHATFFPEIAATDMLADYDHFRVVDEISLQALAMAPSDLRVDLQIFNGGQHGAAEVLEQRQKGQILGSLVLPGQVLAGSSHQNYPQA